MPIPALVMQYSEEARLCWYVGAFVATIFMVQVTFEEWFRSYYRLTLGSGNVAKRAQSSNANSRTHEIVEATGTLESGRPIEKAGFDDFLKQALRDDLISRKEFTILDRVRSLRNPYEHTRAERSTRGPNWFDQLAKISVPELIGESVEDEAREAIITLCDLLPVLCMRLM